MHFDERVIGDYRVFIGALEAQGGDGYMATLIVHRVSGLRGGPREALRDENLACGHRWPSAHAALSYAMSKAQQAIRSGPPVLAC